MCNSGSRIPLRIVGQGCMSVLLVKRQFVFGGPLALAFSTEMAIVSV